MNRATAIAGVCLLIVLGDSITTTPARIKQARNAPVQTGQAVRVPSAPPSTPVSRETPLLPVTGASAAAYEINWQSINAGGVDLQSSNYALRSSTGQSAIGFATSASYETGVGYWYGAEVDTGTVVCSCPFQSDFDEDGFLTSLDLGMMIDILFAGDPDVQDPNCPSPRADFDCDGFSTSLDLGGLIDHLFAGQPGPCDPCNP